MFYRSLLLLWSMGLGLNISSAIAEDKPHVSITRLSDSVYMLQGKGGNLAFSSGPEGVVVIDDQFADMAPPIKNAIQQTADKPIKVVINTHWHGDHTGGNLAMAQDGAVIVAHHNVRLRLSKDTYMAFFKRHVQAAPPAALPMVTFENGLTLHINGDTLRVLHFPHAHTDGDAAVLFVEDNVLHTGDLYFASGYPFIDVQSEGSLDGLIQAVQKLLTLCNDKTRIVPGHGPLSDKASFRQYLSMLEDVRDKLTTYAQMGASVEEVVNANPLTQWSKTWGKGFVSEAKFIRLIYPDMLKKNH